MTLKTFTVSDTEQNYGEREVKAYDAEMAAEIYAELVDEEGFLSSDDGIMYVDAVDKNGGKESFKVTGSLRAHYRAWALKK